MEFEKKLRFSRRSLLKASALSPLAAQLLPELTNVAYAQNSVPTNFIVFYTYQGNWPDQWASGTGRNFQLSPTLKALEPFKNDLILTKRLFMKSAELSPPGDNSSGHPQGQVHSTTSIGPPSGKPIRDGNPANGPAGPSIDQAIYEDLNAQAGGTKVLKKLTPVDSIQMQILDRSVSPPTQMLGRISYTSTIGASGYAISKPPVQSPDTAWKNLFETYAPGGGGTVAGGTPSNEQLRFAQRKLMLKYAGGQFNSLKSRVSDIYGATTADRLEAHANALNEIEKGLPQLSAGGGTVPDPSGGTTNALCKVPERSTMPNPKVDPVSGMSRASGWWGATKEYMPKLLQLGIACGRTRFAAVQVEDSGFPDVHGWHHDQRKDLTIPFHTDMAAQYANMLKLLKDIPTADGKTMLHNSVVLWCGELGSGATHATNDLHWMVAGQAGGKWEGKTGQLIDYNNQTPHTNLFLSIASAMGAKLTAFGDPRVNPKPLTEF
ncbi:MAG: DUF1552 domain-containing protein [Deltaproteobacteria bacterium]|nr:DUF1552 domain-containing protein [Deltaproteobacteria bacterium]